jgi:uncharacterized protein YycO
MGNINIWSLKKGDIIVSAGNGTVSGLIQTATGSSVSHAILYVGDGNVIEALGDGVMPINSWEEAKKDTTLAIALTYIGISNKQRDEVVENAKQFRGLPYDKTGAVGAGMYKPRGRAARAGIIVGGCIVSVITCGVGLSADIFGQAAVAKNASNADKDNQFFCSELVARAYQLAGLPLTTSEPSFTNPREIRMSSKLNYLGHLIGKK